MKMELLSIRQSKNPKIFTYLIILRPFNGSCLNGIEIGIIVIFGLTLFIGILTSAVYAHAYFKMKRSKTYEDSLPMDQRNDEVEEVPKTTTN